MEFNFVPLSCLLSVRENLEFSRLKEQILLKMGQYRLLNNQGTKNLMYFSVVLWILQCSEIRDNL